jgi:predicted nucleotide-binding protein
MTRHQQKNVFLVCRPTCAHLGSVEAFLREIGVRPIVLSHQRPAEALIQRFENYASDAFAIVLMSGEPEGSTVPDPSLLFQLGFLSGRLGRRRITALFRDGLRLPPECDEVLCIPLDEIGMWKFALMRDLVVSGFAAGKKLAVVDPAPAPPGTPPTSVKRLAEQG